MQSSVSVTYEIDDLARAADELVGGISADILRKKSVCGILLCFSDMEHTGMLREVRKRFPHDIIGGTCIANLDQRDGFHEMAATFTVLAADDCLFATAMSDAVTPGAVETVLRDAYGAARAKLDRDPGLIIALPPYTPDIMLDAFPNAFNAIAPGIPVLGGVPSYNAQGDSNLTMHGDAVSRDKLVLLLVSGNIKPVFSVNNVSGTPVEMKRMVTRAKDHVVYSVGSQSFVEYLEEVGIPLAKMLEGTTTTFVAHPLLLENVTFDGEAGFSFMRTLHRINPEDGSGTAIGAVPPGATLSICSLAAEEIRETARAGMADLVAKMRENAGYAYSTILAISCIGRYMLLIPDNGGEVEKLLEQLPPGITLSGFYSYGEVAPIRGEGGRLVNFAHNESLVLCAL